MMTILIQDPHPCSEAMSFTLRVVLRWLPWWSICSSRAFRANLQQTIHIKREGKLRKSQEMMSLQKIFQFLCSWVNQNVREESYLISQSRSMFCDFSLQLSLCYADIINSLFFHPYNTCQCCNYISAFL